MDDIVLNKKESIERCVRQIRSYYTRPAEVAFSKDHIKQDAIALNLQRACQQCIDLANHIIRARKLGLPKTSKDAFRLLREEAVISDELCTKLEGMVCFRNVLIHEYQQLDMRIMVAIIEHGLEDLLAFADCIHQTTLE